MNLIQKTSIKPLTFVMVGLLGMATSAYALSDYSPLIGRGSTDFKTRFAPESSSIAIENNEVTLFSFIGVNSNLQWRTFIPPGTRSFQATMYTYTLPPEAAVAAKFGSPPSLTSRDVTAQSAERVDITQVLQNLVEVGDELPFFSPAGSGSLKLSSRSNDIAQNYRSSKGGWVYFNSLSVPTGQIFKIETLVTVDEVCYRSWFAKARFDFLGNPVEDVVHTCDGSPGGVSALTGISLSSGSIHNGTPITILQVPGNAALPVCTSLNADLEVASPLVTIAGKVVTWNSVESAAISTKTRVRIKCGAFTALLDVLPPVSATEQIEADNTLTLNLKVVPDTSDIGKTSRVFMAAMVPATSSLVSTDTWFFKTATEWKLFEVTDIDLLKFATIPALSATSESFTVKLGLPKALLTTSQVEFHFGYQTDGEFNYRGKVWP